MMVICRFWSQRRTEDSARLTQFRPHIEAPKNFKIDKHDGNLPILVTYTHNQLCILACFVCLASALRVAVFLHKHGGFCTSGLASKCSFWLALCGLCFLCLACSARAVARKSSILMESLEEWGNFRKKVQLPGLFLENYPCSLRWIWKATPVNYMSNWVSISRNPGKVQGFASKTEVLAELVVPSRSVGFRFWQNFWFLQNRVVGFRVWCRARPLRRASLKFVELSDFWFRKWS